MTAIIESRGVRTPDVARLTGATYREVNYWRRMGYVPTPYAGEAIDANVIEVWWTPGQVAGVRTLKLLSSWLDARPSALAPAAAAVVEAIDGEGHSAPWWLLWGPEGTASVLDRQAMLAWMQAGSARPALVIPSAALTEPVG